jgi:GxxExxY protein
MMMRSKDELERTASIIVDAMVCVHRTLGPGLLESAYQACLAHELGNRGLKVECEDPQPVEYGKIRLDIGYRLDVLVEDEIIVENKAVQALAPIHESQLITYLKLSGKRLGFLVNWNVPLIKDGIKRFVSKL